MPVFNNEGSGRKLYLTPFSNVSGAAILQELIRIWTEILKNYLAC